MADRVQVIKWETIGGGGSQEESYPDEIDPNEDGIEARSIFFQNDSSSDENIEISRDASDNMIFKDGVVVGTKSLVELARYGVVPDLIPDATIFVIPTDHQMIVFDNLTVDGELVIDGQSVVF